MYGRRCLWWPALRECLLYWGITMSVFACFVAWIPCLLSGLRKPVAFAFPYHIMVHPEQALPSCRLMHSRLHLYGVQLQRSWLPQVNSAVGASMPQDVRSDLPAGLSSHEASSCRAICYPADFSCTFRLTAEWHLDVWQFEPWQSPGSPCVSMHQVKHLLYFDIILSAFAC